MKFIIFLRNFFWPNKENHYQPLAISDKMIAIYILAFLLVKIIFSIELLVLRQTDLFADISAQQLIILTNKIRNQYGLPPLKIDPTLEKAAKAKAEDMLKKKYFAHYSPQGTSPWYWLDQSGYYYHYAGENLAVNFIDSEEVIRGWLNSPSHRQNLLNPHFQDVGIAVISGDITNDGKKEILVVQMLGSKLNKPPLVAPQVAEAASNQSKEVKRKEEKKNKSTKLSSPPSTLPSDTSSSTTTTITPTTTTTTTTISTKPPTESSLNNKTPPQQINNIIAAVPLGTRYKIAIFSKIIALLLVITGTTVLAAIIKQQQSKFIYPVFSELIVRSVLIIFIGLIFAYFNINIILGKMLIK